MQPASEGDVSGADKYNILRSMYERRLRSVAATISRTLTSAAASNMPGALGAGAGATGPGAQQLPVRVASMIEAALHNEREEEILRLQEELAAKENELARLQS